MVAGGMEVAVGDGADEVNGRQTHGRRHSRQQDRLEHVHGPGRHSREGERDTGRKTPRPWGRGGGAGPEAVVVVWPVVSAEMRVTVTCSKGRTDCHV